MCGANCKSHIDNEGRDNSSKTLFFTYRIIKSCYNRDFVCNFAKFVALNLINKKISEGVTKILSEGI